MSFTRPKSLERDKLYLLRVDHPNTERKTVSAVFFSSYTSCPAYIIIKDQSGKKIRCSRDNLFVLTAPLSDQTRRLPIGVKKLISSMIGGLLLAIRSPLIRRLFNIP